MLRKEAVELVDQPGPGYYSQHFLMVKVTGKMETHPLGRLPGPVSPPPTYVAGFPGAVFLRSGVGLSASPPGGGRLDAPEGSCGTRGFVIVTKFKMETVASVLGSVR